MEDRITADIKTEKIKNPKRLNKVKDLHSFQKKQKQKKQGREQKI